MYNKTTMITLELTVDGKTGEYNIPTGWEDISIKKFCTLFATDVSDLHPIRQSVKHISILSGMDEDLIYSFPPEEYNKLSPYFSFMNTSVTTEMTEYVEVEGEKYYLNSDFKSFNFGEQTSIEIILEGSQGNVMACMDKLLCVFLRKKNEDGELEKFKSSFMDRQKMFENVPITSVYQLFTFFLTTKEPSNTSTETC